MSSKTAKRSRLGPPVEKREKIASTPVEMKGLAVGLTAESATLSLYPVAVRNVTSRNHGDNRGRSSRSSASWPKQFHGPEARSVPTIIRCQSVISRQGLLVGSHAARGPDYSRPT